MEALAQLLLTLGLAVLALFAFFRSTTAEHLRGAPTRRRRWRNIVVSDPAIVQFTLIDHADAFSNRPAAYFPKAKGWTGAYSINSVPHGPLWRALRCNLTSDILHPTRLHPLAALQQDAAEALVADLSTRTRGGGEVVVRDSLHASVFALSARFCFGDGVAGEHCVRALEREVLQFTLTFAQDSALFAVSGRMTRLRHWRRWLRCSGTLGRMYKLVHPIIAARKQSRRTGIRSYVDSLLDLQIPDSENGDDATTTGSKRRPLTDKEIVKLVFEFLGANTESVVSCVEWTLAHLVIDPEVQKKLHREITGGIQQDNGIVVSEERLHRRLPYLRAVMLESLRLHPPVPIIVRDVSAKDAAIAGTPPAPDDAKPAVVITDIHKIGRNSEVWTDPDEFRPERFLAGGEAEGVGPMPGPKEIRMVPFGAGRRYCPGVDLAMVRVGCTLTALVRDFDWALPSDGNSLDLNEFRTFFLMMKTPLRARITPRALAATATATM
ncbi:unnamed protein product [Miscanthus lutarioriparius]|uniref:Cytochrome P450 n=1 Tax=Miscanthus lutarioriparius TaxID=422564 RepID=A0A811QWV1_9POAL|nr:unnamed protein product [Miscanthus lutarioriparius]